MFKNKRLLLLAHSYSSFVKDQVDLLAEHFQEVIVMVRINPLAEIANWIPLERAKPFQEKKKIDLENKPANVTVYKVPILYLPLNSAYLKLGERHYKKVQKIIQDQNLTFDLIHAHFLWSAGYVGAKLKKDYNVPFFVTAHRYDIDELPFINNTWKRKIQFVLQAADKVITVSRKNQKTLHGLGAVGVVVITNGVRSSLFYPLDQKQCREALSLPLNNKLLLSIGNLLPRKNNKLLINSLKILHDDGLKVYVCIVGSGVCLSDLIAQVKQLQLEEYVFFPGAIGHSDLNSWFNAADLFVMPSKEESFGVVQIEALACGIPVVATKNGGSEEVITSEDVGYVVDEHSPECLAAAISKALNREWSTDDIINFTKQFEWESVVKGILAQYQMVLPS